MGGGRDESRDSLRRSISQLLRVSSSRRGHAQRMATVGVALPQQAASVLDHVCEHGPLSMGDLARATRHDPGATARLVAGLEADGLLHRERSDRDGRITLVAATQSGRRTAALVLDAQLQHLDRALRPLSDLELDTCAAHLARLVTLLRETEASVPVPDQRGARSVQEV